MMKNKINRIWKYTLQIIDEQAIKLPIRAKILCAKEQNGEIILYAVGDHQDPRGDNRIIRILGTDHPFPDLSDCVYIDTVDRGSFIWHIFEKKNIKKGNEKDGRTV